MCIFFAHMAHEKVLSVNYFHRPVYRKRYTLRGGGGRGWGVEKNYPLLHLDGFRSKKFFLNKSQILVVLAYRAWR